MVKIASRTRTTVSVWVESIRSNVAHLAPAPALAIAARAGHAGTVSAQAGFFRIRFRADPVELAFFRGGLNRWLLGLDWPDTDRQDAVLAINEACDNRVQHAFFHDGGGEVEVVARLVVGPRDRRIVAVVRDDDPSSNVADVGDAWLTLVNACMDRVQIRRSESGTSVTMTSRPVPLPNAAAVARG
jgi:anti-sigma regulatory factor (Ser/Thr protein kinase)